VNLQDTTFYPSKLFVIIWSQLEVSPGSSSRYHPSIKKFRHTSLGAEFEQLCHARVDLIRRTQRHRSPKQRYRTARVFEILFQTSNAWYSGITVTPVSVLLSCRLSSSGLDWLNSDLGVARSAPPSRPIVNEELCPDNSARSSGLANAPMAPDLNPRLFISLFLNHDCSQSK
jgi:hypothetical protein